MSLRQTLFQCGKIHGVTGLACSGGTYVLLPHDVVEGKLGAPGCLIEGGAAGPAVSWTGRVLHDVLRQREQTLLRLFDEIRLDVVPTEKVVAVLPVALLHLVVTVQTVQSSFGNVDPPGTEWVTFSRDAAQVSLSAFHHLVLETLRLNQTVMKSFKETKRPVRFKVKVKIHF